MTWNNRNQLQLVYVPKHTCQAASVLKIYWLTACIAVSIIQIFFPFMFVASLYFLLITSVCTWYIVNKDHYAQFEEKYINVSDFFKLSE
jgi:hypothetical protein